MKNEVYEKLYLWKKNKKNNRINLKLQDIGELTEKINSEECSIKEKYYLIRILASSISFLVIEEFEKNRLKKSLANILECGEKDIAYDENELIQNEEAKYVLSDIRYTAAIDKKYLSNKKIFLGNLDIRALRDTKCLENLELVGGDLLMGDDAYLPNLKYVFGETVIQPIQNKIIIKK